MDDRRRRLGRPLARQLPLGREGDAGDAGAAVAGRLGDQQHVRRGALVEVRGEPLPQQGRTLTVRVEVEGAADPRGGDPFDEVGHRPRRVS